MLKLGVNVDHVATLRQARRANYPSVLDAALACENAGAHGITVHLREDRRHIQDSDVYELRRHLRTRLNLEMANAQEIVNIAINVRPDEVCIVPERRMELTTEGGLDVAGQAALLKPTVATLRQHGIVVSLFVAPDINQLNAATAIGAPCVELHTGTFCNAGADMMPKELERLNAAASHAADLGLQVNAGHGINLANITDILTIPHLDTLNIGHSIVARALIAGMCQAVREMLHAMQGANATAMKDART